MVPEEFRNLYQSEWHESEQDVALRKLAEEYNERCDAYDNTRLTGPVVRGNRTPADRDQRDAMHRYSDEVRRELRDRALSLGYTLQQWQRALADVARRKR